MFAKEASQYVRKLNPVEHYVRDAALYLSTTTGKSLEECRSYIEKNIGPGGRFELKDPKVEFLMRKSNGDREKRVTTLSKYIEHSFKNKELIAPSFTTYLHPTVKESVLSRYIAKNIKRRSVAKGEFFKAKANKDSLLATLKKIEQTAMKLKNNSISGAHVSPSTPLYNPTAHSTLTSGCRNTSGYGNANNERFLSGNRHYFNREITINNILSVCNNTNLELVSEIIDKYGLTYPNFEQTLQCIRYSTSLYWLNDAWWADIVHLVMSLTGAQRAAVVYVGDFYHLMKFNEGFVRNFLRRLSTKIVNTHPDPASVMKAAPEMYIILGHQICHKETLGVEPKVYEKIVGTQAHHTLACTIENIADCIYEHRDLIDCFWMTDNLPPSVAHFPDSIRRSALTSDTDSTIFTVQDWMIWYGGAAVFTEETNAIYAAVVFLTSSTITHVLATMSGNFGIVEENIFGIKMKSEYMFPVFVPTQLGKHYYAVKSCQEGLILEKLEDEIKGAQLRSANAPAAVVADAKKMMLSIIQTVMENKKISLRHWLDHVADQELAIIDHIQKGGFSYFRSTSIKDSKSYSKDEEDSPYANHFIWNQVFGPKYGEMPEPPYDTYKISVDLDSPRKTAAWLQNMPDQELAQRMAAYLKRKEKTNITTFNLPAEMLQTIGIPEEIKHVINYGRIVKDICKMYYIVLETLGYYALGTKRIRLLHEEGYGTKRNSTQPH
jgi:hypothetical protein